MKDHVFIFVDPFFFAPPPKADSFVVAFFSLFLSSSLHVVDFFFHSSLSLSLTKVDDGTFIIFCGGAISPRRSRLWEKEDEREKKKTAQPTEERERKEKERQKKKLVWLSRSTQHAVAHVYESRGA